MKAVRNVTIYPLVSTLAILSFKKKGGKGSDLGGISASSEDLDLEGGSLSLSDLGGSLGSLSKLGDKKDKKKGKNDLGDLGSLGGSIGGSLGGGLGDDILSSLSSGGGRADDKKFMEIEASVNDLKKQAETADLNSKATKNEIESMKKDLSEINGSIKSLLNVYEAVSRQYNPFVDDDKHGAIAPSAGDDDIPMDDNLSLGSLNTLKDMKSVPPPVIDERGPLDRVVRPDDEEEEEDFSNLQGMDSIKISPDVLGKVDLRAPTPAAAPEPEDDAPARPRSRVASSLPSSVDPYALEQVHKLVEYQLSKVYRAKLIGDDLDQDEVEALDRWMSEFKRLGGG
jgi:hypothetical protein